VSSDVLGNELRGAISDLLAPAAATNPKARSCKASA
jgi:hypothetical protein